MVITVVGAIGTTRLIEPDNGFVRPADLQAMQWIRENIPQDALFHVATYFWTPDTAHGLDAGYWIPLLAGRQTTMPPEIYTSDGTPAYMAFINQRLQDLQLAPSPQAMWQVLQRYRVTHVYIGSRPTDWTAGFFAADPAHFRLVYAQNGVSVYEVIQ